CWTAIASMVHVLVPEYALDAHRDHILHHLLFAGAQHRISAHPAAKPSAAKVAVVPGVRTSTAQADARARRSWGVPFFLSPGITGRSLRSAARPAVRLPARVFPLAFYILPFYIVGDRVRAELFDSRDCGRREGCWQTTRAARSVPTPGVFFRALPCIYVIAKAIDTLIWLNITSPSLGFAPWQFYIYRPFGTSLLFVEIVLFGLIPALLLTYRRTAARRG